MSESKKGTKFTEEHCKNISEGRKGKFSSDDNPNFGNTGEKNAISKDYVVTFPDGHEEVVRGLNQFCKNSFLECGVKLNTCNMVSVASGKQAHHKNFKCRHYTPDEKAI
jgi:hypothetical protein